METITATDAANLVRTLREIAWSDEREANDETGDRADYALRDFARSNPQVLDELDFLELREYLEAQEDDDAKAILGCVRS